MAITVTREARMRKAGNGRLRVALTGTLVLGVWLSAGAGLAAPAPGPMPDPLQLASRASDVRIERRRWDDEELTVKTVASTPATREWLERLIGAGLRESDRWPDSLCAVACRRCPEQLHLGVTFKVASKDHNLSLYPREGLAFLRADSAGAAWSFADSLGSVLGLLREAMPDDPVLKAWSPPSQRPRPLEAASAAFREDDMLVTGMPEPLKKVPPSYPELARSRKIEGLVQVRALVESDGSVGEVTAAKSVPGLDEAAFDAVRAWKFRPATCAERPIPVWVLIPVRFTLR